MKKQLNLLLIAAIALGTTALNADTHNYTIEDSWRGPEISEGSNQIVKLDKNQCYDITINMDGSLSASPSSSYCGHKLNVAWINTIYNKTPRQKHINSSKWQLRLTSSSSMAPIWCSFTCCPCR
jgi:hypothetical protein